MEDKYLVGPSIRHLFYAKEIPKVSNIWNGILRARDTTKSRAKWRVGNGNDIFFWMDNWLIQEPLINIPPYERWAHAYIHRFGTKVYD